MQSTKSADIVASLTKMVHHYWSKFSHVPLAIIRYSTGQLCLRWHNPMSRCDVGLCQCKPMRLSKSHTLIGWCATMDMASHSPIFAYVLPALVVTCLSYGSLPLKCKFLLFNRISVSDAWTKQMMHDGLMWHANICVPQLKCQHSGYGCVDISTLGHIY